jgi:hypothetical protein
MSMQVRLKTILLLVAFNIVILGMAAVVSPLAAQSAPEATDRKKPKPPKAANVVSGDVLIVGGGDASLTVTNQVDVYKPVTGRFAKVSPMAGARAASSASVVVGGAAGVVALAPTGLSGKVTHTRGMIKFTGTALPAGETFNVNTDRFAPVVDTMDAGRGFFTATPLPNGKILIAGGTNAAGVPQRTAEYYDPATGLFSPAGTMLQPRAGHSATLLPSGAVLLAGGAIDANSTLTRSAEVFSPTTGLSTPTGFMAGTLGRGGHTATLIEGCGCALDGKVVIAGGGVRGPLLVGFVDTMIMIYDPATRTFSTAGAPTLTDGRAVHTATLLPGGKLLLAGGFWGNAIINGTTVTGIFGGALWSAELLDLASLSITCVGGKSGNSCVRIMKAGRGAHTATVLANGKVLLAGGADNLKGKIGVLASAELYTPASNSFAATGAMTVPHAFHAAVRVP